MMSLKKIYLWATITPLAIAVIFSIFILFFFRFLPSRLPLFYSLPWGDKQLADHLQFFIIPAILVLITILNLVFSLNLHSAQVFFKKMLISATLISTLILTITFIKIVLIFT